VLVEKLGRPVGAVLEVSAADRLIGTGPPRDWPSLVETLESLACHSGADLVRVAETRGVAALIERLIRELDEQYAALARPIEESRSRVEMLRHAVADAERSLEDLGHRLTAAEVRLSRLFTEERDRFFNRALPEAERELHEAIRAERVRGPALRERAIDHAIDVMKRGLERWRREQEPQAEALYRGAVERFVELVNQFRDTLATVPGLEGLSPLSPEAGFRTKGRVHYAEMLTVAPSSVGNWLLDMVSLRALRVRAIQRDAGRYLERLLEVNSARIKNDFLERVVESRRLLEGELRSRLRELAGSAERAMAEARRAQAAGTLAVRARLEWLQSLRSQIEALRQKPG
jgi:hypothetical protein